jgi:transcriptional regulator NrdR family protein
MFCSCGSKRSAVINTIKIEAGVRRQRRCTDCDTNFYTIETLYLKPVAEKIKPDLRGLYKKDDVAKINRAKVEIRRRIEDRVPSYFIEDDY